MLLALDIGSVRVGVAVADPHLPIPIPRRAFTMNEESFVADVKQLVVTEQARLVVVGYPRNQSGVPTKQTGYVMAKVKALQSAGLEVAVQDESLTSVTARERLGVGSGRIAEKGAIDSEAAVIILEDYLAHYHEVGQ